MSENVIIKHAIFEAGDHGSHGTYTLENLNQYASNSVGAPVGIGHNSFAYDWFPRFGEAVKFVVEKGRNGVDTLFAEMSVIKEFAEAVKNKFYNDISVGIDLVNKKIGHIAFLGATPAKIKGLLSIPVPNFSNESEYEVITLFSDKKTSMEVKKMADANEIKLAKMETEKEVREKLTAEFSAKEKTYREENDKLRAENEALKAEKEKVTAEFSAYKTEAIKREVIEEVNKGVAAGKIKESEKAELAEKLALFHEKDRTMYDWLYKSWSGGNSKPTDSPNENDVIQFSDSDFLKSGVNGGDGDDDRKNKSELKYKVGDDGNVQTIHFAENGRYSETANFRR